MKKDFIVGLLRTVVGLALLWYVIYLQQAHIDIVPNKEYTYDLAILGVTWFVALMMIYVWVFKPCFKRPRIIQAVMWIFLILFANYSWIVDVPGVHLYLRDILNVIGSLALALSFGKVCVYDKCIKQKEEEETEIIEIWDSKPTYTNSKQKEETLEVIEV